MKRCLAHLPFWVFVFFLEKKREKKGKIILEKHGG
jgi:hypothetical protein